MGFFRSMNFPRGVILVSLLLSVGLGYFVYKRGQRLEQIHIQVKLVPQLVRDIQKLGIELNNYQEVSSGEILKGEDYDAETYIREIAADPNVNIGQVKTTPSKKAPYRDVEDHIYKIVPDSRNPRFSRSQIGNFLYKLESASRRVRVTSVKLIPSSKLKAGEIGDDIWTFEAAITTREKVEG
jgi:hypothetical protein